MDCYYETKDRRSCYIAGGIAFVGIVVTMLCAVLYTILK